MKVSELELFLSALAQPLSSSGAKSAGDELLRASKALIPFREQSVSQFADFLIKAEEYQRTGIVSTKQKAVKKSPAIDESKVDAALSRIKELYEKATASGNEFDDLKKEVTAITKPLKKNEVLRVAKGFSLEQSFRTKTMAVEAIQKKIVARKDSFLRTRF